jgi:hypothetical protein
MAKAKKIKRVVKLIKVKDIHLIKKYSNRSKLSEHASYGKCSDKATKVSKPIPPDNIRICKRISTRKSKA